MCCSRDHYPDEVGLSQWENETHHHHIILPNYFSTGICIVGTESQVSVAWRDFSSPKMAQLSLATAVRHGLKLTDILALGVAEGGLLSRAWVDEVVARYMAQHHTKVDVGGEDGGFILLPPEPLEWHEWLVQQAARERV